MPAPRWTSWYYRRWRAAWVAPQRAMPAVVKSQWDFGRFFIIFPAAAGYLAKLILDETAPALGLSADAGNLAFLGIWGGAVVYLLLCGLVSLVFGRGWYGGKP